MNSLLAAHYIAEGMALGPAEKKRASEFLSEATDCLNEAEKRNSGTIEEINLRKGNIIVGVFNVFMLVLFQRSTDVGQEYDRTGRFNF